MTRPAVSVVICAYTPDRWQLLMAAVTSVRMQTAPRAELIVVVDHNDELMALAPQLQADVLVPNSGPRGLSGARNSGLAVARGNVVAFLDDDAAAEPEWLYRLCVPYEDPAVAGVGGMVLPAWQAGRPGWFPAEFDWVVGCSHRGLPTTQAPVRNPIGANMSFRAEALRGVGGFTGHIGRIGTKPVGCEETELSIRIAQRDPDARILFEPAAVVRHHVPPERGRWAYFRARCWSEGISKAEVARLTGPAQALATERGYATRTLPRGVLDGMAEAVAHRRPMAMTRSAAIIAGLAITTAGYATGRLRSLGGATSTTPTTK
jgi:GT2 family glycosyltransferase